MTNKDWLKIGGFIVVSWLMIFYVGINYKGLLNGQGKKIDELELNVEATQKQLPMLTKYWLLVKELSEVSGGKLTALSHSFG